MGSDGRNRSGRWPSLSQQSLVGVTLGGRTKQSSGALLGKELAITSSEGLPWFHLHALGEHPALPWCRAVLLTEQIHSFSLSGNQGLSQILPWDPWGRLHQTGIKTLFFFRTVLLSCRLKFGELPLKDADCSFCYFRRSRGYSTSLPLV